jgi:uncharacterized protein (TIGR02271 family)
MSENTNVTLQVRKEQLDIAKKWIQTGEVKIYKETSVHDKTFTIPITREELVIEQKSLNKDITTDAIRILLNEDEIEFTKQNIALEDVSIYSHQIEDVKHIEATLKREEAKVDISGSPTVIYE